MNKLPILFRPEMVRALLQEVAEPGTGKSQTRRIIEPVDEPIGAGMTILYEPAGDDVFGKVLGKFRLRYRKGDRLYVRETWRAGYGSDWVDHALGRSRKPSEYPETTAVEYLATDMGELNGPTHPSIFMPRWASRLTLIVAGSTVERLQDITEEDAIAEGIAEFFRSEHRFGKPGMADSVILGMVREMFGSAREGYRDLWDYINAKREGGRYAWSANPWVAKTSFKPVLINIDKMDAA